jgi:hypothetical protein
MQFSVHTEVQPERGEDAEPLLHTHGETACHCVAVFDGMGGAGALPSGADGPHSDAFRAARLARHVVEDVLQGPPLCAMSQEETRELVERSLRDAFQPGSPSLGPTMPRTRLISRMIHRLPTTLAMAVVSVSRQDIVVRSLWAGDSRIYALTPELGLMQLTRDHARHPCDAFDGLYDDSPLSNFISADTAFRIEAAECSFRAPVLVFAATDGCFGYWRSPMHLEEALLTSLCEAQSVEEWEHTLRTRIGQVAADDVSLAAVAVARRGLRSFSRAFHRRLVRLRLEHLPANPTSETADLRQLWQSYRRSYETWTPPADE